MAPRLSIVTVVKNDVAGLTSTRDSILRSSSADLACTEWIVIDSSANRSAVAAVVSNNAFTTALRWVPPEGVYEAMNAGLAEATGDYTYFLNAGDTLTGPEALNAVLAALDAYNPTWLYGQVSFLDRSGNSITPPAFDYASEARANFSRGRFPPHQGTVARTSILRSFGGFDTSYRITADYTLMLRLSQISRPVELSETLATFEAGGISQTRWLLACNEFHRARLEILQPRGLDLAVEFLNTGKNMLGAAASRAINVAIRDRSLSP